MVGIHVCVIVGCAGDGCVCVCVLLLLLFLSTHLAMAWMHACACFGVYMCVYLFVFDVLCVWTMMWPGGL